MKISYSDTEIKSVISFCILIFSFHAFGSDKAYLTMISNCEDKMVEKSCTKVKSWCDEGDGRACRALAGYLAKLNDLESAKAHLELACKRHDEDACKINRALAQQKSEFLEKQQADAENRRRAAEQFGEEQASLRRLNAVQALANGLKENGWDQNTAAPQMPMRPQIIQVVPVKNPNPYHYDNNPYNPQNNPFNSGN